MMHYFTYKQMVMYDVPLKQTGDAVHHSKSKNASNNL